MDLLIALVVFAVGFMTFGSLFYGAAKLFLHRKMGHQQTTHSYADNRSSNLKVNKTHNVYSFK